MYFVLSSQYFLKQNEKKKEICYFSQPEARGIVFKGADLLPTLTERFEEW